ncbi:hypothetical protein BGW80DRAFT_615042 [Lactifluus volemus]|nr:hypothetical protein BGW80DRAFT_615042 [Lactifluus volemus]
MVHAPVILDIVYFFPPVLFPPTIYSICPIVRTATMDRICAVSPCPPHRPILPPQIANTPYCLSFIDDVLACLASPSPYVPLSLISLLILTLYPLTTLHVAYYHLPLSIPCDSPVSFVCICTELL